MLWVSVLGMSKLLDNIQKFAHPEYRHLQHVYYSKLFLQIEGDADDECATSLELIRFSVSWNLEVATSQRPANPQDTKPLRGRRLRTGWIP